MTALDNEVEIMCESIRESKDALELAILMLKAIADGKQFDPVTYRSAVEQMNAVFAIATLENAHTHVIANCEKYTKDYQSFVEIIYNLQAKIQREFAINKTK